MTGSKKRVDRRKHKRILMSKQTFAILKPDNSFMVPLVDISPGGFSFKYMDSRDQLHNISAVSILHDGKCVLKDIPVKTISDISADTSKSKGQPKLRRHSMKFQKMTPDQAARLENLIKNRALRKK